MKKAFLGFSLLISLSALASGTYNCDISISKDGGPLGKIAVEQQFGMSSGRLFTIPVSKKSNVFGKTVEEVEVALNGFIMAGTNASESALMGEVVVLKITNRRTIRTEKTLVAAVDGSGDLIIEGSSSGYTASGACVYKH